jgi:hypothetical protein
MSILLQRREDCGQLELHRGKIDRSSTGPMGVECFKDIVAIHIKTVEFSKINFEKRNFVRYIKPQYAVKKAGHFFQSLHD